MGLEQSYLNSAHLVKCPGRGSNVPGPTEPIFFSGARLVRVAGLGPLLGGLNLIHVVASYNGTLSISATADRDALPDPATYAGCMETAFQQLLASAC